MQPRYDNTRVCIDNDYGGFIDVIKHLDEQYYFREQAKKGNPLKYDWFVDPSNFLKVIEGNYKEPRKEVKGDGFSFDWSSA